MLAMVAEIETRKGERTRAVIMDAAYALFLEQGFHGTSMRQVADRAGMAVGGIYNYYSSKEELFRAILLERHPYQQILPLLVNAPGESVEEFVQNGARSMIAELGNRPDFIKLMFIEIVEFNGENLPLIFETVFSKVVPLMQRFMDSKERLSQKNPAILFRAFLGLFFSYYILELMMNGIHQPGVDENTLNDFVDIFLHGILIKE
jgi:AcrR family transcriptional regulator